MNEVGSNPRQLSMVQGQIAFLFQGEMKLDSASDYFFKALKNAELASDSAGIAMVCNWLGTFNSRFADASLAPSFLTRALDIANRIKNDDLKLIALNGLANYYYEQKDFKQSLNLHLQYRKLLDGSQIVRNAFADNNIGACFQELNQFDSARFYFQRALYVYEERNLKYDVALTYYNLGTIEMELKNYPASINLFNKCLDISRGLFPDLTPYALTNLAKSYSKSNQFEKSAEVLEEKIKLNDSLALADKTKQIAEMNAVYQTEKKQQQIESLEFKDQANKKKQQLFFVILILAIAGGVTALLFFMSSKKKRKIIEAEKEKSDKLLLNILPHEVAEELKLNGSAKAHRFEEVTVLFSDIKDFTRVGDAFTAEQLVEELNYCFSAFDNILSRYKVEKIKTVGDAYICVGGLPTSYVQSAIETLKVAKEMQAFMSAYRKEREVAKKPYFEIRIGLHTGPVIAGIVGIKKYTYDIWGDTVNTAARMEQHCEVGKINISETTKAKVENSGYKLEPRGKVKVKGKGEMEMYYAS